MHSCIELITCIILAHEMFCQYCILFQIIDLVECPQIKFKGIDNKCGAVLKCNRMLSCVIQFSNVIITDFKIEQF